MVETATEALVRMANQIAANYSSLPTDEAAAAVARHLRTFWAPSMRSSISGVLAAGTHELSPVAAAAVGQLDA